MQYLSVNAVTAYVYVPTADGAGILYVVVVLAAGVTGPGVYVKLNGCVPVNVNVTGVTAEPKQNEPPPVNDTVGFGAVLITTFAVSQHAVCEFATLSLTNI